MPRRRSAVPADSLTARFVHRMQTEQEQRGWSDEGLAKRASSHFPISRATIWKLKNSDPPRRLDLDEANAIAQAFGAKSAEQFVAVPVEFAEFQVAVLESMAMLMGAYNWLEQYKAAYLKLGGGRFTSQKSLDALASPDDYEVPKSLRDSPLGLLSQMREQISVVRELISGELDISEGLFMAMEETIQAELQKKAK